MKLFVFFKGKMVVIENQDAHCNNLCNHYFTAPISLNSTIINPFGRPLRPLGCSALPQGHQCIAIRSRHTRHTGSSQAYCRKPFIPHPYPYLGKCALTRI